MNPCADDRILNILPTPNHPNGTRRCVKRDGTLGRRVLAYMAANNPVTAAAVAECPQDSVWNTRSLRCVKRTGKKGRQIINGRDGFPQPQAGQNLRRVVCPAGTLWNNVTKRCNRAAPAAAAAADIPAPTTNTITTNYRGRAYTAEIEFHGEFMNARESKMLFDDLSTTNWDYMYERSPFSGIQKNARKMKWYSELPNAVYSFSNNSVGGVTISSNEYTERGLYPNPLTPVIREIRRRMMLYYNPGGDLPENYFNSVLINFYEDGKDSVAWHSDDDKWLGNNFVVPSITLGAERDFLLRSKSDHSEEYTYTLSNGSLLFMKGMTQDGFQHTIPSIPKRHPSYRKGRINLTFRRVVPSLIDNNAKGISFTQFKHHIFTFLNSVITDEERTVIRESTSPKDIYRFILDINKRKRNRR